MISRAASGPNTRASAGDSTSRTRRSTASSRPASSGLTAMARTWSFLQAERVAGVQRGRGALTLAWRGETVAPGRVFDRTIGLDGVPDG